MKALLTLRWPNGKQDEVIADVEDFTFSQSFNQVNLALRFDPQNAAAVRAHQPVQSEPTGSETTAQGNIAGEPDPRKVKCPVCPHPMSEHSDQGCIAHHVTERLFRSPGVMGYCNCTKTYSQGMKEANGNS